MYIQNMIINNCVIGKSEKYYYFVKIKKFISKLAKGHRICLHKQAIRMCMGCDKNCNMRTHLK